MSRIYSNQPRLLRAAAAFAALLFLATFAPPRLFSAAAPVRAAIVSFERLTLDSDSPGRRRVGSLTFVEGWKLTSNNPRFGGISALHVDGNQVLALSDAGSVIRFSLPGRAPNVVGTIDALSDGPGSPNVKADRDTESLALFGNHAWIGFERRNVVWRYTIPGFRSDARNAPDSMRGWSGNSGAEGMVRLADGRFIVFSESSRNKDGTSAAVLFDGDPALPTTQTSALRYRSPLGYQLTDADQLPDGRLLILNRRFSVFEGVSAKLVVATVPRNGETPIIEGSEIADLRAPANVDNMEGLHITSEGGRTIVWLASDDNFHPLQRTLLMKFVLEE